MMQAWSYKIISKIAEDDTGEYFRATMFGHAGAEFSKTVTIKKYFRSMINQPHILNNLEVDVKAYTALAHPNIVQTLNFYTDDKQTISALEFIDGLTLRKLLDQSKSMNQTIPWQVALFITTHILQGLEYAHTVEGAYSMLKFLHREIDPKNILISYSGEIKVANFESYSLKKMQARTDKDRLRKVVSYSSPEILTNENLTPASDVFSVGVILYELLTSQHPTGEIENYQALEAVEAGKYDNLLEPNFSPDIARIVLKAMSASPSERYWSAGSFYEELVNLQDPIWIANGQSLMKRFLDELIPQEKRRSEQFWKSPEELKKEASPTQQITVEEEPDNTKKIMVLSGAIAVSVIIILGIAFYQEGRNQPPAKNVFIQNSTTKKQPLQNESDSNRRTAQTINNMGMLQIEGPEGTEIFINGKKLGKLPISTISLPPKSYKLEMKHESMGERTKIINIESRQVLQISW